MASKDYWIDLEELSELGRELAEQNFDSDLSDVDICNLEQVQSETILNIDDKFKPIDDEVDIKKIGSKLAEIKRRAEESGILSSKEQKKEGNLDGSDLCQLSDLVSGGSLVQRLKSFVQWAYSQELLTGIFISDLSGNELIESGADPIIVRSGIELAEPYIRLDNSITNAVSHAIHSKTQVRDWEGSDLVVFVADSAYGKHVLGILTKSQLSSSELLQYREGFCLVMGLI
ncbi:MAG: hypothetical protein CMO38_06205 [Verrucomicrobiaceae bacterium]|nr:hypothetical protein [Verrucomicrobiaceae bacterium]